MKSKSETLRMLITSRRKLAEKLKLTEDKIERKFLEGQISGLNAAIYIVVNNFEGLHSLDTNRKEVCQRASEMNDLLEGHLKK